MRIVAGTYEGFCYGWESTVEPSTGGEATLSSSTKNALQPSLPPAVACPQPLSLAFGYNVHVGCMKSVAMAASGTRAGTLLVTGGVDERVRIYDLRDRTELGELQQHNGSVTCMEFYKSTHLLTGSEDHAVCIWRVHDWALLHVLGGHKGAVTSLSIHPTGRMALSVSRDRTLRLWNLLEGRCAYVKRLQGEGELVRWSPSGDRYLVVVGSTAVVYSAATSESVGECKHDLRVNSACFVGGEGGEGAVATCSDDKSIRFFTSEGGALLGQLDVSDVCPTGRVRDMCHVAAAEGGGKGAGSGGSLVAVTSAGGVHVWGVPDLEGGGLEGKSQAPLSVPLLATHSVKGEPRFTCVSACLTEEIVVPTKTKKSKKRQQRRQTAAEEGVAQESGARGEGRGGGGRQGDGDDGVGDEPNKKKKQSKRKKLRELQKAAGGGARTGGQLAGGGGGGRTGKGGAKRHRKV
ncbi:unnamed protein product [Laminaria digitata]